MLATPTEPRPLSPETRAENLERMKTGSAQSRCLDLLVIGGGITGAGVARDAARRGLRVALVERRDFAAGTSSRSSKLIHGGVRYLQHGDFALVRESAMERRILGRIAPHLVHPALVIVPTHSRRAHLALNAGLWTYERLGGVDAHERHVMWDRGHTLERVPLLRRTRLHGAAAYFESLSDDARLVLDTLKDAHAAGALIANYAEATALHLEREHVAGVQVHDLIEDRDLDVAARVVINAAGPWVDAIRRLGGPLPPRRLHLTKGVHLTLARKDLPVDHVVVFTARDRRSVFVVPRGEVVYVGTTDTDHGGPTDRPDVTSADVQYLLAAIERTFLMPAVGPEMVLSAWAGLRPLLHKEGKKPSEISRKDEIMFGPGGLVSIAGGKLTTYRRMAMRVVDLAVQSLDRLGGVGSQVGPCDTDSVPLPGGDGSGEELRTLAGQLQGRYPHLSPTTIGRLVDTYGTQTGTVLKPVEDSPDLGEPVAPAAPLLRAEVRYAIDHEMALGLEDILDRRTRLLLFAPDQGLGVADAAAAILSQRLGWSAERTHAETAGYRALAATLRPRTHQSGPVPDSSSVTAVPSRSTG